MQRCPLAGHTIEFAIDDALGGTRGFLLISTGVTPIPFKTGCALDLNIPMTRLATFATSAAGLWAAGILIGVFAGPNQSASRSLMLRVKSAGMC